MAVIPFVGPQQGRSVNLGAARYLNLYPHQSLDSAISILGTPGLRRLKVLGDAPVRALLATHDYLYAIAGNSLYRLSSQFGSVLLSSRLNTFSGPAAMAWNGHQLLIVDGVDGYLYDADDGTFTTPSGLPVARTCCFLDGYFIVAKEGTGQFFFSDLYDGASWDALDFNTAEASPDHLVAVASTFGMLFLLGETSTEVWYNAGDPDTVFRRIEGMVAATGCAAPYSVAKVGETGNQLLWLAASSQGHGYAVANTGGSALARISTAPVEYQWARYARLDDAIGYGYTQEGHVFYVLTFPSAGATWVYDLTTQTWHERQSGGGAHLGICHAFFAGRHVLGRRDDGHLLAYDLDAYTDDGLTIMRELTGPTLGTDEQQVSYQSVQIDMERGTESTAPAPRLMLDWSNDAGRTWVGEVHGSVGKVGDFTRRVVFRRLGRSYRRTFRVRISDPVKVAIREATVQTE